MIMIMTFGMIMMSSLVYGDIGDGDDVWYMVTAESSWEDRQSHRQAISHPWCGPISSSPDMSQFFSRYSQFFSRYSQFFSRYSQFFIRYSQFLTSCYWTPPTHNFFSHINYFLPGGRRAPQPLIIKEN